MSEGPCYRTETQRRQASVYLSSLVSDDNPTRQRLARRVAQSPPRHYRLVGRAQDAEIILFVESGYIGLESIARLRAVAQATSGAEHFIFSESDWPFPYIPGLYCSLRKRLPWAFSWSYLLNEEETPPVVPDDDRRYLFSFVGRVATNPVRRKILALDGPDTPCLDSAAATERFPSWDRAGSYSQMLSCSRFVLCPRGIGASSVRLFEAMRAARVPIIIGDEWIEPPVGDWPRFSIRVPEGEVARIPKLCEQHVAEAARMGALAKRTYEAYFSPATFLDSALDYLRGAAPTARSTGSPAFARNAARAISGRELRTAAHHLLNTARSVVSLGI